MDKINKAIEMLMARAKEDNGGEDIGLNDGDLAGVFNDAVVTISINDNQLQVKVIAGEPYTFDYDLDLLEES